MSAAAGAWALARACPRCARATTSPRCCATAPTSPATCSSSPTRSSPRPRARCGRSTACGVERARARPGRASTARTRATCRSILDESAAVLRAERGVLICRTHHGFVCANAGVDASNAPAGRRARHPAARPRRERPRAARRAAEPPGRGHRRLLRPRLAPRAVRRRRSASPGSPRSTTGAGAATRAGSSCARPRSRSPTRPRRRPTWCATRRSREPAVVVRGLERHVTDDGRSWRGGARAPARRGPVPLTSRRFRRAAARLWKAA